MHCVRGTSRRRGVSSGIKRRLSVRCYRGTIYWTPILGPNRQWIGHLSSHIVQLAVKSNVHYDWTFALRFLVSPFAFGGRALCNAASASFSSSCSPDASHSMCSGVCLLSTRPRVTLYKKRGARTSTVSRIVGMGTSSGCTRSN